MTYPSIQIKGNDDAVVETIKPEDLEKMLNQGTVMDDGIHFTKDGKEYVIQETTQPGETKLSNAEIVDRLKKDGNKNYELGADGEIYYTTPHNETVKLDVTQNELLRRSLTYKVTLTTTEKGDPGTAGEQIATEKAKKDAIRSALTKAVDKLGIEDAATASQLKAKISDLKFTQEQLDKGDTFTAEIGGKTYTLTYSAAGAEVTETKPTDATDTGKKPEDIIDVKENTVKGTAYVTAPRSPISMVKSTKPPVWANWALVLISPRLRLMLFREASRRIHLAGSPAIRIQRATSIALSMMIMLPWTT